MMQESGDGNIGASVAPNSSAVKSLSNGDSVAVDARVALLEQHEPNDTRGSLNQKPPLEQEEPEAEVDLSKMTYEQALALAGGFGTF